MFDMGFSPQISAILAAVRPDRQTLLFSATFPKQIEKLARQSLKYPVEVMVGGRSVASDSVTQYAELVEEPDKFHRLLQILGEQVEGTKKVIVFVDTQVRADSLFEQLLRNGYSTLSLHGGKEQEDRDSTLSDFKRKDGPNVLVATGVAARGLDVPACTCVVNLSAPNHLEAYVHQAGRTGRAGKKGVCYTLVSSDEAQFAPIITRALHEAGQAENVSDELKTLAGEFKAKVESGEAKYAGSGFKGKGFTYDSTEMNEAQRIARIEKRQALIEAGLLDPEEEDLLLAADSQQNTEKKSTEQEKKLTDIPDTLTPELLALPGMKEAFLRKAGITPTSDSSAAAAKEESTALSKPRQTPDNHWIQEFEINNYPREARWKVTQKETTARMQDEFRTAVIMKGSYFPPGKDPGPGERKVYLHLESTSDTILRTAVLEIQRMLNEETLRVSAKASNSLGSHKYNVV
jgi:ATP-dependent RNA helicase DDX46/PRP5